MVDFCSSDIPKHLCIRWCRGHSSSGKWELKSPIHVQITSVLDANHCLQQKCIWVKELTNYNSKFFCIPKKEGKKG